MKKREIVITGNIRRQCEAKTLSTWSTVKIYHPTSNNGAPELNRFVLMPFKLVISYGPFWNWNTGEVNTSEAKPKPKPGWMRWDPCMHAWAWAFWILFLLLAFLFPLLLFLLSFIHFYLIFFQVSLSFLLTLLFYNISITSSSFLNINVLEKYLITIKIILFRWFCDKSERTSTPVVRWRRWWITLGSSEKG